MKNFCDNPYEGNFNVERSIQDLNNSISMQLSNLNKVKTNFSVKYLKFCYFLRKNNL